jgi:Holliday junction resolvase-like predicted endonuclease
MISPELQNQNFWNIEPKNGSYHVADHRHAISADVLGKLKRSEAAKLGETLTESWANSAGWRTLYQGLRHVGFELDLVLRKERVVRIIEVKTLRQTKFTPDLDLICGLMNKRKIQALKRGANFLLTTLEQQKLLVEQISCELVVVNLKAHGEVVVYRWPDACVLR